MRQNHLGGTKRRFRGLDAMGAHVIYHVISEAYSTTHRLAVPAAAVPEKSPPVKQA